MSCRDRITSWILTLSKNQISNSHAYTDRRHRTECELRPVLVFAIEPGAPAGAQSIIHAPARCDHKIAPVRIVICEVESTYTSQAFCIRLKPADVEMVPWTGKIGFSMDVINLVKIQPVDF